MTDIPCRTQQLSALCVLMVLATFGGVSTVFGAISYFEVRPGPAKPSPVGTTITIFQGTSKTIRVNGHGTDFAKSVSVSGRNVSARITGRKNGLQHKHYKTNLPLGEVSLRVTARSNARLGTRTVTIRYPVGQDRFKIRIKKKPASGSVDVAGRKPGWPRKFRMNKLASPLRFPQYFGITIGIDHKRASNGNLLDCANYHKLPFPYCYQQHVGTDYLMMGGELTMDLGKLASRQWVSDVVAAAPGTIVEISEGNFDRCFGDPTKPGGINCQQGNTITKANYVIIKQDDDKYASYQHLQNGSVPTSLKEGDRVKCGQKLGRVGSSGRSAYPHLHFQLSNYQSLGRISIDPYKLGLWISLNHKNVPNGKCPLQ